MRHESILEWPHHNIFYVLMVAHVGGSRSVRGSDILDAVMSHERERLEVAVALEPDSLLCSAGFIEHDDAAVFTRRRYRLALPSRSCSR